MGQKWDILPQKIRSADTAKVGSYMHHDFNLSITARKIVVLSPGTISISGQDRDQRKKHVDFDKTGCPGWPGRNSGNFALVCGVIQSDSQDLPLLLQLNGGNGGKGGPGGDAGSGFGGQGGEGGEPGKKGEYHFIACFDEDVERIQIEQKDGRKGPQGDAGLPPPVSF